MAHGRAHDTLVDVLRPAKLHALDAVLLGIQLKVDVVEHTHGLPVIYPLGVILGGVPAHDAGHDLSVAQVEGVLIVLFQNFQRLFRSGNVAHVMFLLFMIFAARQNGQPSVDLFQHHDPGQMVGKGHGRHGQPEIRLPFQPLVQPP